MQIGCSVYPEGIETVPKKFAIHYRNKWMLDKTDIVVTYVTRNFGGAWGVEQQAAKLQKPIIKLVWFLYVHLHSIFIEPM